jgi:hypothetical protein
MKVGFWKLNVTAAVGNEGIDPYGMCNKSSQLAQFKNFLPFGFPSSAVWLATNREGQNDLSDPL